MRLPFLRHRVRLLGRYVHGTEAVEVSRCTSCRRLLVEVVTA